MFALLLLTLMAGVQEDTTIIVCKDVTNISQEIRVIESQTFPRGFASVVFKHNEGPAGSAGQNLAPGTCAHFDSRLKTTDPERFDIGFETFTLRVPGPSRMAGPVEIHSRATSLSTGITLLLVEKRPSNFNVVRMVELEPDRDYDGAKLAPTYDSGSLQQCEERCIYDNRCKGFNYSQAGASRACTLFSARGGINMHYRAGSGYYTGRVIPR